MVVGVANLFNFLNTGYSLVRLSMSTITSLVTARSMIVSSLLYSKLQRVDSGNHIVSDKCHCLKETLLLGRCQRF